MNLPQTSVRWAELLLVSLVAVLLLGRILPSGRDGTPPSAADLVHRVDLNAAPWHELADLPGIGEARARSIVADREARGPFSRPEDLERVAGVGPATVEGIRGLVKGMSR